MAIVMVSLVLSINPTLSLALLAIRWPVGGRKTVKASKQGLGYLQTEPEGLFLGHPDIYNGVY